MIRTKIFRKAQKLLSENRVSVINRTENKVLFEVKSNETHYVVVKQNHTLTYECDCEFYMRRARYNRTVICSHVLACLIYLFERERKS